MSNKNVVIRVKVDGEEFETVLVDGVQRFKTNHLFNYLVDTNKINLNDLSVAYQNNKFSKREYMLFLMGLGYSVCGFSEISNFEDLHIENPIWE